MTIDSDDMISLPGTPPPRPAARRAAIDAAMRHFDGVEEAPGERATRKRRSPVAWATTHRGPAGALVSAALLAIVFIPAMPFILRDPTPRVVPDVEVSDRVQPNRNAGCAGAECAGQEASEPRQAQAAEAVAPAPSPSSAQPASPAVGVAKARSVPVAASDRQAEPEAPAPVVAAPPPPPPPSPSPPPPPPPSAPQAEANREIAVSGSRIPASNLASQDEANAFESREKPASRSAMTDPSGDFLSRLQVALKANDRHAIIQLIGLPLRVMRQGRPQTYRSAQEVERDFDRIFTTRVKSGVLDLRPESLMSRYRGRLKGNRRLWFGCGEVSCSRNALVQIREVHP